MKIMQLQNVHFDSHGIDLSSPLFLILLFFILMMDCQVWSKTLMFKNSHTIKFINYTTLDLTLYKQQTSTNCICFWRVKNIKLGVGTLKIGLGAHEYHGNWKKKLFSHDNHLNLNILTSNLDHLGRSDNLWTKISFRTLQLGSSKTYQILS